jgi:hypothetical protein
VAAGTVTVEFRRGQGSIRRDDHFDPGVADEDTARQVARALAEPLAAAGAGVRSVQVRLSRLARRGAQASLFPALAAR